MSKYTKEQLRSVFQRPFDKETWKTILIDIFRANNVRVEPEKFTDPAQSETGWYMGNIETPDNYRIGLFFYRINSGSVAHKKVGLRNLVRSWVNPNWGEFDAAIVVFSDGTDWRLSFVCDIKDVATSPKRFTFVFGEKDNFYRTPIERFTTLQNESPTFKNIHKAFSVEALSDDFFDQYRDHYADFVEFITGKRYVKEGTKWVERVIHKPNSQYSDTFGCDDKLVRDYIKKMFGRIVFLYFLQRKKWLDGNRNYMHDLFVNSDKKDDFLDGVLEPLFFEILNTDKPYRTAAAKALPGSDIIPYLNGGLFAADEIDELDCKFPESLFAKFFNFLDSYNFTIDENDIDDAEIGIDPEMLGRIFENLLEDNKDKGAFYTPKEIVDYMCRESIIAYLQNDNDTACSNESIRQFVETYDGTSLSVEQRKNLKEKLKSVKICDPAIGSGAFPMGLVNLLSKLYSALRLSTDAAVIKRHIMEQNIYGVDIEKGAVDIARLRFWLAMIVEEKDPIPLPNLHFKIMQGNSLLESYQGVDLSDMTKVKPITRNLFDSDVSERETLVADLKKYYETSDHTERDRLFNDIIKNVRRQLFAKNITLPQGMDPSANEEFFLWHTWFADVFVNGGFDIVIGNPPYLKEGRASKAIFGAVKDSPYYQGKMDIWYMFACLGIDMLKPDGNLCFIATNNWVTSSGAKKLRQKINTDAQIIQLCDFKDYMIFKTASIQTMIMQFKKNKAAQTYQFDLRNLLGTELENVVQLLRKEHSPTTQYLEPTYNRLEMRNKFITFSDSEDLFKMIRQRSDTIFLENKEIAQGIVFPQDFLNKKGQQILGHHNVGDGIFGLTNQELSNLNLPENEMVLIKPYYTTEQVKRYFTPTGANTQWLIYTDSTYKDESSMDSFPVLKAHLDQFRPIFTSDNKPYGLHRARDPRFFSGSKIICQRKCAELPIFSYSDGECYLTQTFNIIKTNRVNLRYLTGLLNSKLIAFWLRNRGKMQGLNYQLDKEPLQQIPITVPEIEVQTRIGHLIDEIIERKSTNANASIQDVENQIDIIVYHLYDLTYDEVQIVDPETTITREEYESYE